MKLFFHKLGEGPALVILHGLYGSSDNWITVARKLSEHFTVYLVDLRNHGRSPHVAEHSYQAMAADLNELFIDEGIEKAYLMGHSMGGKTAMLFAAQHPEKISRLIVVDIAPGRYTRVDEPSEHSIAHLNIVNAMLSLDFSQITTRTAIDAELAKFINNISVRQFIMKNVHRNANHSFSWKLNIEAISKGLPNILGAIPLEKTLQGNVLDTFPTLFIRGENSDYITGEHIPEIYRYFPNAEIKGIPDAGHWVHADQPEKFMETLTSFLL
ncbi:MAG: alpha/beta fold hydrolase [Bacteroidota bacterium]|nr:alpha/beta fold hydrolase [Bacteroidota bacterium]